MASDCISRDVVFCAWRMLERHARRRPDVAAFAFDRETRCDQLYQDIVRGAYRHGPYRTFVRHDPKRRVIAAPSVRDQIVHYCIVAAIGPMFEQSFHPHSYASRPGKGVLAAVATVHRWIRDCSDGGRRQCFALRMDIRQYFASVDHGILRMLLARRVHEPWWSLCCSVIESFGADRAGRRCGIPLGNVTSQLFANVYLHELDRFAAHVLRVGRYARYMDDWVVVGRDVGVLAHVAERCCAFLRATLRCDVPDAKVSITPVHRGVDWLGAVLFPHHRVLRPETMRRLRQRIRARMFAYLDDGLPRERLAATLASYDGLLRCAVQGQERERLCALFRVIVSSN